MEEVFKKYWEILVADAYKKINDSSLAEDCAQETFIVYFETLQKGATFEDEKQIARYLFKVNQNNAAKILSSLAAEKKVTVWQHVEETVDNVDFDAPLLKEELSERLDKTLRTMDPKEVKLVISHFGYDVSYKELADQCGITKDSLRRKTIKSLDKITEEMRKYKDDK